MQRTPRIPRTPTQRRLDLGLGALAVFTAAAVGTAVAWDSRPAQSAAEPRYTPPTMERTDDTRPTALFVGDSYSQGTGATSRGYRWTAQAANDLGWKEQNIAAGGTGYINFIKEPEAQGACGQDYCPTYAEAIEEYDGPTPDIVVVAGGLNDRGGPVGEFQEAVEKTLKTAVDKFPDAEVYAVNPVWRGESLSPEIEPMIGAVKDAANATGVTAVDIGQPLIGEDDVLASDDAHPNNKGHAALANAFAGAIE